MYSTEELANDFRKLGIGAADAVMLHASVRAVEEVAGGPDQLHLALKSVDGLSPHLRYCASLQSSSRFLQAICRKFELGG